KPPTAKPAQAANPATTVSARPNNIQNKTMPSEAFRRHFIGSASEKTDSDICGKSKGNYIDKPLYKFKSLIYIAIFFFQFVRFSITFHFQDHFMTNKPDLPDSRLRGNDGRVYF
ncbi:hypothetical protein MM809_33295, partial [Klebsiella pneumoniae]|nr:hypothetical protein [Klebsiella pneumoniae]